MFLGSSTKHICVILSARWTFSVGTEEEEQIIIPVTSLKAQSPWRASPALDDAADTGTFPRHPFVRWTRVLSLTSVLVPEGEEPRESMPGESEPGEATVAAEQRQGPAGEVDHTWELSKENVMPLVRGRKVDCIRRAFGDSVSSDRREGDGGREEDEEAAGFAQGADAKTVLLAIRRWVHAGLHVCIMSIMSSTAEVSTCTGSTAALSDVGTAFHWRYCSVC